LANSILVNAILLNLGSSTVEIAKQDETSSIKLKRSDIFFINLIFNATPNSVSIILELRVILTPANKLVNSYT
jgi:hypothetical protein